MCQTIGTKQWYRGVPSKSSSPLGVALQPLYPRLVGTGIQQTGHHPTCSASSISLHCRCPRLVWLFYSTTGSKLCGSCPAWRTKHVASPYGLRLIQPLVFMKPSDLMNETAMSFQPMKRNRDGFASQLSEPLVVSH